MSWRTEYSFFLFLLLFGCNGSVEEQDADQTIKKEYASKRHLIEADELINALRSSNELKLIDFRTQEQFSEGHIPGALNIWRTEITDTTYHYGGMMAPEQQMEDLLGSLGISPADTIIIYDDRAAANAARLWWILKVYGHVNMSILNGGLNAWSAGGGELNTEIDILIRAEYNFSGPSNAKLLSDMSAMKKNDVEHTILLDTRSSDEFSGAILKDGATYSGSIPGAENLDWHRCIDPQNNDRFHSADSLFALVNSLGITGDQPVVTYCHSGVRSAHTLFVLTELLGYGNVSNYDGSWIEWTHLNSASTQLGS